ncbi:MAG TPA: hypothetical protein VFE22_15710 [Edaphobacter sp.]|nr:hypothetical protein [Edaphobacter sp.]
MMDESVAQRRGFVQFVFNKDGILNLSFVDDPKIRVRAAEALRDLPEQPSKVHLDLLDRHAMGQESITFFALPEALRYLRGGGEGEVYE